MDNGIRNSTGKQRKNRELRGLFWFIILPVLFFLVIWSVVGPFGIWKLETIKTKRDQLQTENENKTKINAEMEQDINRFKTDRNYQEQTVRKELGYVREGEIVYEFIGKKNRK